MDYYIFFTTDNKSGWKSRKDRLNKKNPSLVNLIESFSQLNKLIDLPFREQIWCFINNRIPPTCPTCDSSLNFKSSIKDGYNTFCSTKCSMSNTETQKKIKETSLEKYGVDNPSKSKVVRDKYIKTCLEKYGVTNVSKLQETKDKVVKTTIKHFGVASVLSLESTKIKLKESSLLKYGVTHPSKSDYIKNEKIKTNQERYGVDNPMQCDEIKDKVKKTNNDRYGVDNPMQCDEVKDKVKKTNQERYGVNHAMQCDEIKDMCHLNNIDKLMNNYGDGLKLLSHDYKSIDIGVLNLLCSTCDNSFNITRHQFRTRGWRGDTICVDCNPLGSISSKPEMDIVDFITSLGIDCVPSDRNVIKPLELDIYIPSKKIAIEYNGLYWHSELYKDNNYHINKTNLCENVGIKLIHIFEDEWINTPNIVKSRIMNLLGVNTEKIYARKCEIKSVPTKLSKQFLTHNHIQGSVNSSIKLGLFHDNVLVSLMTFGKLRMITGQHHSEGNYELLRFCNVLNTSVVGGASRLLKHFIKNNKPKSIISYADRRWSQGDVYNTLGFQFTHNTKPNYWYVVGCVRKHRFNYRKDKLVLEGYNKNSTEKQIMLDRGIYRVYDSGNKKYIYTK